MGDYVVAPNDFQVTGLRSPVELLIDEWGVPHLYAQSVDDVFLAQGFNAARDRLFQIDLWRRRGLGLLSEAFGAAYLAQDRASRLLLYRGDMRQEWNSYGPDAERIATSFACGINAYLDWLEENPEWMPEEFRRLGHTPARWSAEDVVRVRTNSLAGNLTSEVPRSRVACAAGPEATEIGLRLQPEWATVVPDGFDPCSLPQDVLDVFRLATQEVRFSRESGEIVADAEPRLGATRFEGSNNWVISGARTETGRPILANDPHRAYSAPSVRYIVHLSAPGMDVIGAGEPAVPGISIGHNGAVGFGLTVFPVDQEDLYFYELDPDDHSRYRYQGRWETMRTVTEHIPVAGAEPAPVRLSFTRHGPVLKVDEASHRAYAVRAAWLEPGMAPYLAGLHLMRATDFEQFSASVRRWGMPSENQVYADVHGNIGWVPGGRVPRRVGYDGLFPVPGDGSCEWDGFLDPAELPSSYNPERGFFATANQMNLPPEFPYQEKKIGFEWSNPYRFERISEVLSQQSCATVADSARLQGDQLSIPARRILAILGNLSTADESAAAALALLRDWDAAATADSAAAALFGTWRLRHLEPGFVREVVPDAAELIPRPDTLVLLEALEHPELWFGAEASVQRDELLVRTLSTAYADVTELLGPDSGQWRWGNLVHSLFEHPMSGLLDEIDQQRFNVGPLPRGGDDHTVNLSGIDPFTFRHVAGPSFRMVLDVGNWDRSLAMNTPGQSGDPNSPHYRDLAWQWSRGEFFPLSYSRAAVLRHTKCKITLLPR